jgi:hypothetical protein
MWAGTPKRLEIQIALLIDTDFYLSLRGWGGGIPGRLPLVVLLLVLGCQQFPWVLLTLFILPTLFMLLLILILFLIFLTLFILLTLILILLSLMEVVMMLVLKVLKKLLYKLLYLINLIILGRERQRMGIAIQW